MSDIWEKALKKVYSRVSNISAALLLDFEQFFLPTHHCQWLYIKYFLFFVFLLTLGKFYIGNQILGQKTQKQTKNIDAKKW